MKIPIITIKHFLIVCTIFAAQSCYVNFEDDGFGCESGHGSMVSEDRALHAYNRITNAIGADISLRQGLDKEFSITGPANILDNVTTRIIDGELVIDYNGCFRNADIDIFITNPEIAAVHNIGSGDIYGENHWETEQLDLRITGSGKIDAEFTAHIATVEITGSGQMDLYGSVDHSAVYVSGSGNIFAFNLETNDQKVRISGSGNCEVFARDILEVEISGSGNVYYKGNPSVSTNISGSGHVIESN